MEVVELTIFNQTVEGLKQRIAQLESAIRPFLETELDGEKILTYKEACEYVLLTPFGLNEARRQGRIKGVKVNGKEYGYKKRELDKYKARYKKAS